MGSKEDRELLLLARQGDSSDLEAEDAFPRKTLGFARLHITGMTCSACVATIESILKGTPGVLDASVSLLACRAEVKFDPKITNENALKTAIDDIGFGAEIIPQNDDTYYLQGMSGINVFMCVHSHTQSVSGLPAADESDVLATIYSVAGVKEAKVTAPDRIEGLPRFSSSVSLSLLSPSSLSRSLSPYCHDFPLRFEATHGSAQFEVGRFGGCWQRSRREGFLRSCRRQRARKTRSRRTR
jgi:copper chaperone CopZ